MGVRFIIFYLLVVVCRDADGARGALRQQDTTGYGATKDMKNVEEQKDDASYINQYGEKEGKSEVGDAYSTGHGYKPTGHPGEVEDLYTTRYISAHDESKEVEDPYITRYISTQRNTIKVETPDITRYISAQGTKGIKEVEEPYIIGYISAQGTKETTEVEAPYITGYISAKGTNGIKEVEVPYITGYISTQETKEEKEVDAPYITGYISSRGTKETKEVEAPYITGYISAQGKKGLKKVEEPYITGYISAQGTKDLKEVEAPYITGYISAQGKKSLKEIEEPYITGYISTQGTKDLKEVEAPYITGCISARDTEGKKEVEAPYITGYISARDKIPTKKCKHQEHVHQPSQQNGATKMVSDEKSPMEHQHHNHMHAHSSSPMDHTKALKQGFFTLDDLYKGNALPLHFPKQDHTPFLPKETADYIPFSTSQLPHLLQLFSIPHESRDAKHMAFTLEQCELIPIKGETKFCATSLESMIDFVQKIIGSGVTFNILSTTHLETSTAITQKYTILEEPKQVLASKMVFCHPVPYPYAVFFCHHFENDTKFFKVSLGGENGDKVKAVAVCHMDTSDWDPNHNLFHLLGIKAGASSPVCHFFPKNHLVWIPSSPTTTDI